MADIYPPITYSEFTLPNGLRTILHQDRKSPVVTVNLAYHVGSKDENDKRKGFAHLFEHLMFEGSKHVPKGDFDRYISEAGGHDNAYTTEDKTNYYETLPSHQLELALWLESDRMLEFSATEIGLSTQKNVVKEEKRERYDNAPYGSLHERMSRLMYSDFPYKWTVIGDMDTIDAATLVDVREFFEAYYTPDNAILVLAGDFELAAAEQLVDKYFGEIPAAKSPIQRAEWTETELTSETIDHVDAEEVPLPAVFQGYRTPPDGSRDFFALDLLTDILSTGRSSRLYQSLIYKKQIASEASAFVDAREMPGVSMIYAMARTPDQSWQELSSALDEVLDDVLTNGVTEQELDKAKNKMESRVLASRFSVQGKAEQLAHAAMFYGSPHEVNELLPMYRSLTIAELHQAAKKYFDPKQRGVVAYSVPLD